MSSKTSKNTRARKARASNKTERHSSPLAWAKAYLAVPAEALTAVNVDPKGVNPFIQQTGGRDTIAYVCNALELMSQLSLTDAGIGMSKELEFGQFLILQTMVKALKAADAQLIHDEKRARARGIVECSEGGAQ